MPSSSDFSKPGISIKEKIKIFSGEFIKRKIYKANVIPGKLKIPSLFQKGNAPNNNNNKPIELKDNSNIIEGDINEDSANENKENKCKKQIFFEI